MPETPPSNHPRNPGRLMQKRSHLRKHPVNSRHSSTNGPTETKSSAKTNQGSPELFLLERIVKEPPFNPKSQVGLYDASLLNLNRPDVWTWETDQVLGWGTRAMAMLWSEGLSLEESKGISITRKASTEVSLARAGLFYYRFASCRKQKRCMPKGQGQAGNDLYWKKFKPLKSLTSGNSVDLLGLVLLLYFYPRTGEEREEDALRERVRYLDLVRERRNLNCNTAPSENNTAITDSNQQSPSTPGSSHDIYIYEDHPGLNLDSERVVELQAEIGEKFREAVKSAGDERLFSKPEDYIAAIEQLHGESESIEFLQSLSDDLVKNGANGETYKEGIQMWIDLMMSSPLDQFSILPLIPMKIGDLYFSFTNPSLFMLLTLSLVLLFLYFVTKKGGGNSVPNAWQSLVELIYDFVPNLVNEQIGGLSGNVKQKFFPCISVTFTFSLFRNLQVLVGPVGGVPALGLGSSLVSHASKDPPPQQRHPPTMIRKCRWLTRFPIANFPAPESKLRQPADEKGYYKWCDEICISTWLIIEKDIQKAKGRTSHFMEK
ncbi:UNVERIFIED_CONTAM: ATP synthase subunit a [Sesamum calycinum]|uniref:F-ATPase protein 6 n=1 Tax=Sesamum calycinum TaxID=2727403 RepID=A0AAW2K2M6_9LAMI